MKVSQSISSKIDAALKKNSSVDLKKSTQKSIGELEVAQHKITTTHFHLTQCYAF
jgi:hypothetical protein